jgi:hypothetical protein
VTWMKFLLAVPPTRSRISSTVKGSTKQFGWLQAPAIANVFVLSNFHEPRNHPN